MGTMPNTIWSRREVDSAGTSSHRASTGQGAPTFVAGSGATDEGQNIASCPITNMMS